ncbi:hypothetical protein SGPA1_22051 [Streptomyces misionensis JCM 4497]
MSSHTASGPTCRSAPSLLGGTAAVGRQPSPHRRVRHPAASPLPPVDAGVTRGATHPIGTNGPADVCHHNLVDVMAYGHAHHG